MVATAMVDFGRSELKRQILRWDPIFILFFKFGANPFKNG